MSINPKDFSDAASKSVDRNLPVGGWPVYEGYEIKEREYDGRRYAYVVAPPWRWIEQPAGEYSPHDGQEVSRLEPGRAGENVYSPMRMPALFLEFAMVLQGKLPMEFAYTPDEASETELELDELANAPQEACDAALDWARAYGVLGHWGYYPDEDGSLVWGRFDDRESVFHFCRLSTEANRVLRLWNAATNPDGPDDKQLRQLKVRGKTPAQQSINAKRQVGEIVQKYLETETFVGLYQRSDGTYLQGRAARSLLGFLYMQMSDLMTAPREAIRRCRWCGDIIYFPESEPPPSDAPRGTRRKKHKTHSNRLYCKSKDGVENYCKNQYNAARRRTAKG
jgi:hypothetical protein